MCKCEQSGCSWVPCNKPLNNGDIISVDCGVIKDGYYGDHAYTFKVGMFRKN